MSSALSEANAPSMVQVYGRLEAIKSDPSNKAGWRELVSEIRATVQEFPETSGEIVRSLEPLRGEISDRQLYKLANNIAWDTRTYINGDKFDDCLMAMHVAAERRRFMFDFDGLSDILEKIVKVNPDIVTEDQILSALSRFTLIRRTTDSEKVKSQIEAAFDFNRAHDMPEVVADIIAHAVWLNFQLEDQGLLLEDVCRRWEAFPIPASSVLNFRMATALRLQGKYEKAIERVERALSNISGSGEFAITFSEQCVRERELSVSSLLIAGQANAASAELDRKILNLDDRVAEIREAFTQSSSEIRREVFDVEKRATTRTVEVVTLFTAAAAFALGGISTVSRLADDPKSLMLAIGGFGSTLTVFCAVVIVLLQFSVSEPATPTTSKLSRLWHLAKLPLMVVVISLIQLFGTWIVVETAF